MEANPRLGRPLVKMTCELPPRLLGDLQAEQYRILRTQIPILYAVLSINTGILCFSVYGAVSPTLSLVIPGIFAALIMVRVITWLGRRPSQSRSASRIARHLLSTTLIAGVISLGLGLWGVALLNSAVADKPFVPLFIAFGAIACAYCLASLPRAAFATISLATTPVIFTLLTSGIRLEQAAGLNLLLIFILILRLVAHQYDRLVDSVITHTELKTLAYADPLTGLPNRRAFIECLADVIEAPLGASGRATIAMIDLDGFKAINDTYGHAAGDAVLIQAAGRIQAACISGRMVARLGGDEFAALIVGIEDPALIVEIGNTLVREMNKPFAISGSQLRLAASVGFAQHDQSDASAMAIVSRADVALYEVKYCGGGGVLLFTPAMGLRLRRRMVIEQALRETNPAPQIEVVYQPIFDARTRQITSFEALARWNHPELGPINPLEFIGVAEQTGTIGMLSEQIFSAAIGEAAGWAAPLGLSINMSGIDLCRPSTPLMIMSLCSGYGFDPTRLEVEVTETSVLSDFDVARSQLDLLREVGIRVVLDDFGSGYASISYLKEITFDRVKLDGELIGDIIQSPKARRLVQGILQLCAAIGVPITAEKVETEDQLAVLVGLGCDRLQGYLLSRPVSSTAARALATVRRQVA
jgi:diguanylate cyclase (GGDEF)-like protein